MMTLPAPLRTERLFLRPPAAGDAESFIAFATSDRARFLGGPMSRANAWRMLAAVIGHWHLRGFGLWAVCPGEGGAAMASVGCLKPEGWPEGEIAWHVWTDAAEGRGIAAEAARAALTHAFGALGWTTAVSYISPDNARSIALARRLGAVEDHEAATPEFGVPVLVFRHPAPETLQ